MTRRPPLATRVGRYLRDHPDATADEVAAALDVGEIGALAPDGEWRQVADTSFNTDDDAYPAVEDGECYRYTVDGGDAVYETVYRGEQTFDAPTEYYESEVGAQVTLHTGSGENTATDLYWGSGNPVWNNGGDTVIITNADGETVLEETYS